MKAEQGIADYQFFWGIVSEFVYREGKQPWELMPNQASYKWFYKAADQGHVSAMLFIIGKHVDNRLASKNVLKNKAIKYAKQLLASGFLQASRLLYQSKQKPSERDILTERGELFGRCKNLELTSLKNLAMSYFSGSYENDDGFALFDQQYRDLAKAETLYSFIVKKYADGKSAFNLANMLAKNDRVKALTFYKQSAELGYEGGMRWLGEYYACNDDNTKALIWLKKADLAGDQSAIDSIEEIRDLGYITNCENGWVY